MCLVSFTFLVKNMESSTRTITENQTAEKKTLVLRLREKKVTWDEEVVNNEFLGKKNSKSTYRNFP